MAAVPAQKPMSGARKAAIVMMALGGLMAVLDRRYRAVKVAAKKAAPVVEPATTVPNNAVTAKENVVVQA